MTRLGECSTEGSWWTASCVHGSCLDGVCVCEGGFTNDNLNFPNSRCALWPHTFEAVAGFVVCSNVASALHIGYRLATCKRSAGDAYLRRAVHLTLLQAVLLALFSALRLSSIPLQHALTLLILDTGVAFEMFKASLKALIQPLGNQLGVSVESLFPRQLHIYSIISHAGRTSLWIVLVAGESHVVLPAIFTSVGHFSLDIVIFGLLIRRASNVMLDMLSEASSSTKTSAEASAKVANLRERVAKLKNSVLVAGTGSCVSTMVFYILFSAIGYLPFTTINFGILCGINLPLHSYRTANMLARPASQKPSSRVSVWGVGSNGSKSPPEPGRAH